MGFEWKVEKSIFLGFFAFLFYCYFKKVFLCKFDISKFLCILAWSRDKLEKNLSTVSSVNVQKFHSNMRTYTQTVDNLWKSCDLSIYSMLELWIIYVFKKIRLWVMWKTLLICWYYGILNVYNTVCYFVEKKRAWPIYANNM